MLRHRIHSSSMSKITETSNEVLKVISDVLDLNTFFLTKVDEENSEIISVFNRNEEILKKNKIESLNEVFCKFVIGADNGSFVVNDLLENVKTKEMAMNRLGSGGSFLGVPVLLKTGEIFGTLCAIDRKEHMFTDRDENLFKTMAELIAQVIELQWHSNHDALTLLYNRSFLTDYFETAIERNEELALLFLDINRFKLINDTAGHSIGDKILRAFADRLYFNLPKEYVVVRLGGDEFAIIIPNIQDRDEISRIAKEIIEFLKKPFYIEDNEYIIESSIGISLFPSDTKNSETLIQYADTAMYDAKMNKSSEYRFYSFEMSERMYKKMMLELGIRKALDFNEFSLFYQPVYDLKSGEISSLECMIRWEHPTWGVVEPTEFIPLAEEVGLIREIGQWMLRQACAQSKNWQTKYTKVPIVINISDLELLQQQFVRNVKDILKETGLEAKYLIIEITEKMKNEHMGLVVEKLTELREIGIKIAVDDFGTGYFSLNYFEILPIDIVKIDKSIVRNVLGDISDVSIVEAAIHVAKSMDLVVIIEGIETKEQFDFAILKKIDKAQGSYLCPPVPVKNIGRAFQKNEIMEII